jgi:hypothetical protein
VQEAVALSATVPPAGCGGAGLTVIASTVQPALAGAGAAAGGAAGAAGAAGGGAAAGLLGGRGAVAAGAAAVGGAAVAGGRVGATAVGAGGGADGLHAARTDDTSSAGPSFRQKRPIRIDHLAFPLKMTAAVSQIVAVGQLTIVT